MRPVLRLSNWHPAALLALVFGAPLALLGVLRAFEGLDVYYESERFHLWVVAGIAACAVIVAVFAAGAAVRSGQHGPVWLAVGCLAVGILMLGHGLLTPHVHHRPYSTWIGRLPYIAIPTFAVCLALASRPRNARTSRMVVHYPAALLTACTATLVAFVFVLYRFPKALSGAANIPHENTINWIVVVATSTLLLVVARVHWRRYRLGHDPVQFALLLVCAMSLAAVLSMRFGVLWQISWWDYHVFLLTGFGGAVYTVVARSVRTSRVDHVLWVAFDADAMTHLVEGYPEALRSLVRAVEIKDAYTAGHSRRTATVAVQLGLRLGVNPDALRALARGAYLHDVGKISIPDAVLNKPAALTPEERRHHRDAPALRVRARASRPRAARKPSRGPAPPRALGRHRLSRKAGGNRHSSRRPHRRGRRRVGRDGLRPRRTARASLPKPRSRTSPPVPAATSILPSLPRSSPSRPTGATAPADEGDADTAWVAAETCHEAVLTTRA